MLPCSDPSPVVPEIAPFCITERCWTAISTQFMPALDLCVTRERHKAIKLLPAVEGR